ncbi:hypothetical protein [Kribbella solani]|uniref:Uncharacterized protein n=1 Tax=Kribbella solani TaxID=236067 RepID=A0A841DH20_9ACTN|nr:hypothetical protein [Kribbella solani]MBB5978434.1 hypothetical protein [Kribbella solani]
MSAVDGAGALGAQLAVYRAVWRVSCGAFLVFAVIAAALLLPAETLVLAILIAVVAGTTAASMYGSGDGEGAISRRWTRRQVVTAVTSVSGVTTLVVSLAVAIGPAIVWLVVLLAAGSPQVVQWSAARLGFGPEVRRRHVPNRSTAELCRQWRDSYEALRHAKTDNQRLRIVMERQRCLDELGRRDPAGLDAWLSSAASAGGDPARFIRSE